MRVWDVHPGYLSRSSLLGQHGEIHALYRVIADKKKGYANHPETLRWHGHLQRLKAVHDLTVREMLLRGFRHHTPLEIDPGAESHSQLGFVDPLPAQFELLRHKYQKAQTFGRIPLPLRTIEFWEQHKYSLLARGNGCLEDLPSPREDLPLNNATDLVQLVHQQMTGPIILEALAHTSRQIWTELADLVEAEERNTYMAWPQDNLPGLISFLYTLAMKYGCSSLLQSTVFADV